MSKRDKVVEVTIRLDNTFTASEKEGKSMKNDIENLVRINKSQAEPAIEALTRARCNCNVNSVKCFR